MSDPTREALDVLRTLILSTEVAFERHRNGQMGPTGMSFIFMDTLRALRGLDAALSTTPAPTVTYEIVATALRAVGLDYIEGKAREDEVDWIAGRLTDAIRSALSTTPAPDPACERCGRTPDDPIHHDNFGIAGTGAPAHAYRISTTPAPLDARALLNDVLYAIEDDGGNLIQGFPDDLRDRIADFVNDRTSP